MAEPAERLMTDNGVVTIGLYATQTRTGRFGGFIDSQVEQIEYIREKMTAAAVQAGQPPPKFVLSVLVVPDWDIPQNSYDNAGYLAVQHEFMTQCQARLTERGSTVELQNAYATANVHDKQFLLGLRNLGANADWVKTHAIVRNHDRVHLQLDSNTQILDYSSFWRRTFGQREHDAIHDGLNASAYDPSASYVSPHNKVVYTIPTGKIARRFVQTFDNYCAGCNDKDGNSIYSKYFCPELAQLQLVDRLEIPTTDEGLKSRYLVRFRCPEYQITQDVLTAVNMSWAQGGGAASAGADPYAELKQAKPLKYKDASVTFPCFLNLVTVHTAMFRAHADRDELEVFRNELHNRNIDMEIIKDYAFHIHHDKPSLLPALCGTIPPNPAGEALCREAFGCSRDQLIADPNSIIFALKAEKAVQILTGMKSAPVDAETALYFQQLRASTDNQPSLSSQATPSPQLQTGNDASSGEDEKPADRKPGGKI